MDCNRLIMLDDYGCCYSCEYVDKEEHDEPCIDCPIRLSKGYESKWKRKRTESEEEENEKP